MHKKLVKRNKRFLSQALKKSRRNGLWLGDYLSLLRTIANTRMDRRLEKRHGTYVEWDEAEDFLLGIIVPVKLCHNHSTISYHCFAEDNLPKERLYLLKRLNKYDESNTASE